MHTEIARTILAQMGGTGRVGAMIGVKHYAATERGVGIRWNARAKGGLNHVEVVLDASDTYTMSFYKIAGLRGTHTGELLPRVVVGGVYADTLVRMFEDTTGLHLHF